MHCCTKNSNIVNIDFLAEPLLGCPRDASHIRAQQLLNEFSLNLQIWKLTDNLSLFSKGLVINFRASTTAFDTFCVLIHTQAVFVDFHVFLEFVTTCKKVSILAAVSTLIAFYG